MKLSSNSVRKGSLRLGKPPAAAQRDALVAQIVPLLEAAEFNGTPIPEATTQSLIQQAQSLLSSVEAYASGL